MITHSVQRQLLQNLVLFPGLQFVDELVSDEEAAVCASVESVHLKDKGQEQRETIRLCVCVCSFHFFFKSLVWLLE